MIAECNAMINNPAKPLPEGMKIVYREQTIGNERSYGGPADFVSFRIDSNDRSIYGIIDIFRPHSQSYYEVSIANAAKGYGPLIYDAAMSYCTKRGYGLKSGKIVSKSAKNVWKYYRENRTDVKYGRNGYYLTKDIPMTQIHKNPKRGYHPDLFSKTDTRIFVPVSELTESELEQCNILDFSNSEWNDLDYETQNMILENSLSLLESVGKSIAAAVEAQIEELKSQENIKRDFIAVNTDPYNDCNVMYDSHAKEWNESDLAAAAVNPQYYDFQWIADSNNCNRRDWYTTFEELNTLEIKFTGDELTIVSRVIGRDTWRRERYIDYIQDAIGKIADDLSWDTTSVTVDYEMPGCYVGDFRWSGLKHVEKRDVSVCAQYLASVV